MTNKIILEVVDQRPFAGGHEFGATGAYERLRGWAHHAVDPKAPGQVDVTDIDNARVNAEG